jgi:hypothetical protein
MRAVIGTDIQSILTGNILLLINDDNRNIYHRLDIFTPLKSNSYLEITGDKEKKKFNIEEKFIVAEQTEEGDLPLPRLIGSSQEQTPPPTRTQQLETPPSVRRIRPARVTTTDDFHEVLRAIYKFTTPEKRKQLKSQKRLFDELEPAKPLKSRKRLFEETSSSEDSSSEETEPVSDISLIKRDV